VGKLPATMGRGSSFLGFLAKILARTFTCLKLASFQNHVGRLLHPELESNHET
jgi:hypothetical protein